MDLQRIALNLYSYGYAAGFVHDERVPNRTASVTIQSLPMMAKSFGLGGIEFPFDVCFGDRPHEGATWIRTVQRSGLRVAVDIEQFRVDTIARALPLLRQEGIMWCRIKIPLTLYGGAQYRTPEFGQSKGRFIADLRLLLPLLRTLDMRLLVENHQDCFVQDLLDILRATSTEQVGLNWDTGNALATGTTPQQWVDALGAFVGNIHVKDYRFVSTPKGVGLLRCALGDGVVDIRAQLRRALREHPNVPLSIELGAQVTRVVDVFERAYWDAMLPVDRARHETYMEFLQRQNILPAGTGTPFEQNKSPMEIVAGEHEDMRRSVDALARLEL